MLCFCFFNDPATTEIYTLSLHDALPIYEEETEGDDGSVPKVASDKFKSQFRKKERRLQKEIKRLSGTLNEYETYFEQTLNQQGVQQQPEQAKEPLDPMEQKIQDALYKRDKDEYARLEAQRQQSQQAVMSQHRQQFMEEMSEAAEKYDDFDEVVYKDNLPITENMSLVAQFCPNGPEILYRLAKNPKEVARIAGLPPLEQIKAMIKHAVNQKDNKAQVSKAAPPFNSNLRSAPAKSSDQRNMSYQQLKLHLKNKSGGRTNG